MSSSKRENQIRNYDNFRKVDMLFGLNPNGFDPHSEPTQHTLTTGEVLSVYDYGYFRAMEQVRVSLFDGQENVRAIVSREIDDILCSLKALQNEFQLISDCAVSQSENVNSFATLDAQMSGINKKIVFVSSKLDDLDQSIADFIDSSQDASVNSCDSFRNDSSTLQSARFNCFQKIKKWPSTISDN